MTLYAQHLPIIMWNNLFPLSIRPHKASPRSVRRLHEELSRLLSNFSLNRSGCDWDAALQSHKHHADKQTCDFSLQSIWRFGGEKMICISACWQTPEGLVCSFCIKHPQCLLCSVSSPSVSSFSPSAIHTYSCNMLTFISPHHSEQKLDWTPFFLINQDLKCAV